MSMEDAKKNIIHYDSISWLIVNGYIPRLEDYTIVNGKSTLNFKPGDFYMMGSRHWSKTQEPFPTYVDYANMWGQDLERNLKALEFTTELCKNKLNNKKPEMVKKMITALFEEAYKYFDMAKFPSSDTGNFGAIRSIQDVSQAIQRRIVAAEPRIKEELENLLKRTPRTSNDIREIEIDEGSGAPT